MSADEPETSDRAPFPLIAQALRRSIEAALPNLRRTTERQAAEPIAAGKWSRKQIIGHLIDSAANNHQRFVRAQEDRVLMLPGYRQEHWVQAQHYQDRSWDDLMSLWSAYNHHLAHVIEHIPEDLGNVQCTVGADAPVTLRFLAHDYVVHLRHHLRQAGGL
ncbi:MAG TPA: DinB family protein [Vicinamibacterales bacterium]|nr:DinB family protein [Vicinamibacterales bacterium]